MNIQIVDLDNSTVYTAESKELKIGDVGYFYDKDEVRMTRNAINLDYCEKGEVCGIDQTEDIIKCSTDNGWHDCFIPETTIYILNEEKKEFRGLKDIEEFMQLTNCKQIGKDIITLRDFTTKTTVYTVVFNGYKIDNARKSFLVYLGATCFDPYSLKEYEFKDEQGNWKRLGVEF